MTVTFVAASTPVAPAAAAPQTGTPTLPAGTATGNRVYVMAASEPTGALTLSANGTGWTLLYSSAPGSVQLSCWWRDKDATWSTMPTVSNAIGTSTTNALIVGAVAFATDATWVTPSAADYTTGSDTTSATSFAATGAATLPTTAGEYLFAFYGTSGNSLSSAQAMSAPGATLGTVAELADLGTATGGAVGFKVIGAPVTAGPATGAPTMSATLSGSNTGSVYFIRVRDTVAGGGGGGATTNPVIRSFSVGAEASGSNTVNVTKPAGLVAGDYLLAFQAGDADNVLSSPLATLSSAAGDGTNNIPPALLSGRVATSADAAAASFTFTSTYATGDDAIILVAIQTGTFDPANPITVGTWTRTARTTTGTQTAPSITGVVNGLLLALFATEENNVAQTYPAAGPAGMTLVTYEESPTHYSLAGMYSQVLAAAGATGTRVVTPTGSATTNGWSASLAMINPAPVSGPEGSRFLLVAA